MAIIAALATAGLAAVSPGAAFAASCTPMLTDTAGNTWWLDDEGAISEAETALDFTDIYDGWGYAFFGNNWNDYYDADDAGTETTDGDELCSYEEDGREVVYPEVTIQGLAVSRKTYVDPAGRFARVSTFMRNPGTSARTVDMRSEFSLGSDSYTELVGSDTGQTEVMSETDRWAATAERESTEAGISLVYGIANVFDSTDLILDGHDGFDYGGLSDTEDRGGETDDEYDYGVLEYDGITLAPGQTVAVMHVTSMTELSEDSVATSRDLAAGPDLVFTGLSADEQAMLLNWSPRDDVDRDGAGASDNCATKSNADQADLDGDDQGDACDGDVDNDGLSNDTETAFGTDPRATDSDGDGKADKADGCPTRAGTNADGCPVEVRTETKTEVKTETQTVTKEVLGVRVENQTQIVRVPSFDRFSPQSLSAAVKRSGHKYRTSGVLVPPQGLNAAQACGVGRLSIRATSGTETISIRRVNLRKDCTYRSTVRLTEKQRRAGASGLTFAVRFAGNQRMLPFRAEPVSIETPSASAKG